MLFGGTPAPARRWDGVVLGEPLFGRAGAGEHYRQTYYESTHYRAYVVHTTQLRVNLWSRYASTSAHDSRTSVRNVWQFCRTANASTSILVLQCWQISRWPTVATITILCGVRKEDWGNGLDGEDWSTGDSPTNNIRFVWFCPFSGLRCGSEVVSSVRHRHTDLRSWACTRLHSCTNELLIAHVSEAIITLSDYMQYFRTIRNYRIIALYFISRLRWHISRAYSHH